MKAKLAGALMCLLALSGCASTPSQPEWVINPKQDTNSDFYDTGLGGSLTIAKKVAMSAISERLLAQLNSKSGLEDQLHKINGKENHNTSFTNNVRIKSNVVLTGVEFVRVEQIDGLYYVEAKISKEKVKTQALSEIAAINQHVDTALLNKAHSDPLVWWLKYRDVEELVGKLARQWSILTAINPAESKKAEDYSSAKLKELIVALDKVKNQLLVKVDAGKRDSELKGFLVEQLNAENINITSEASSKVTHNITISSDWRQNKMLEAYISTVIAKLSVKNKQGKTVASSEVIATGNSVSNYKMSKEGAARHFSAQISDKGIWHSLGLI